MNAPPAKAAAALPLPGPSPGLIQAWQAISPRERGWCCWPAAWWRSASIVGLSSTGAGGERARLAAACPGPRPSSNRSRRPPPRSPPPGQTATPRAAGPALLKAVPGLGQEPRSGAILQASGDGLQVKGQAGL